MTDTPLQVRITSVTHPGMVRTRNEDSIVVAGWVRSGPMVRVEQHLLPLDAPVLCLVADGMGGCPEGKFASQYVALRATEEAAGIQSPESLAAMVCQLNDELFKLMEGDPGKLGMGTTVAGIWLSRETLLFFNVGDSHVYQERSGFLRRLSVEDTLASMSPAGPAGQADEPTTRQTSAVLQCLGGAGHHVPVTPHIGCEDAKAGQRYLLCTDGLTDMLSIANIEACLLNDDHAAVSAMLDKSLAAGGKDNISILLLTLEAATEAATADNGKESPHV